MNIEKLLFLVFFIFIGLPMVFTIWACMVHSSKYDEQCNDQFLKWKEDNTKSIDDDVDEGDNFGV